MKTGILAIALAMSQAHRCGACVLFSTPPTVFMPNFGTLLYSAFRCCWSPFYTRPQLRWDKSTSTWTEKCPDTSDCEYGASEGDTDTCPICLLGPGETCNSCSGECGEGLLCKFPGPFDCSGECVWEKDFNSRELGESCGAWDGDCDEGLSCKYDDTSALLLPFYGCLMHFSGECVADETFNSRNEGENCGQLVGFCADGLECVGSIFPWCPRSCRQAGNESVTAVEDEPVLVVIEECISDDGAPGEEDDFIILEVEDIGIDDFNGEELWEDSSEWTGDDFDEIGEITFSDSSKDGEVMDWEIDIVMPDLANPSENFDTVTMEAKPGEETTPNVGIDITAADPTFETILELEKILEDIESAQSS